MAKNARCYQKMLTFAENSNNLIFKTMKKIFLFALMVLTISLAAHAQELKKYENKAFSIEYPADWEVTWDGNSFMNLENPDEDIQFNITFNEQGPMKSELQECVDNWVYMKESHGHKVDQKKVMGDYALVRSIETDEDDGTQTVEVWFLMISFEPQCFSGTIKSPLNRANEALDVLVKMLATLSPK